MFVGLNDLLQFLEANNHSEGRSYEYKKGLAWNDSNQEFKHKIIKAILSMSNIRDGGYIILGVEKNDEGKYEPLGFDDNIARTYEREKVLEAANTFADPYIDLELKIFMTRINNYLAVIQVFEFKQEPVICKKNFQGVLEQGRIYTRTFRKPESSASVTSSDLREIIDLAIDKQVSKLQVTLSRKGFSFTPTEQTRDLYKEERGDF